MQISDSGGGDSDSEGLGCPRSLHCYNRGSWTELRFQQQALEPAAARKG